MAYIDIDVDKNVSVIDLGMQGENLAEGVRFILTRWFEDHGSGGTAFVYIRRAEDESAYFRQLDIEDEAAVWDFTATDTARPGTGRVQVLYEKSDIIKKSVRYKTLVAVSEADSSGDEPDPYEDYLPEARSLLMEVAKNRADADASAAAADVAKRTAAASEAAASGSAETALAYAQQAAAVFAQVGDAELVVNEDSSVTAIFTKEG